MEKREKAALKNIFIRLLANGLVRRGGKRYNELVDECRDIAYGYFSEKSGQRPKAKKPKP